MSSRRSPWLTLTAILVYCFLYLPIVVLVVFAFNSSRQNVVFEGIVNRDACGPFYWFCRVFQNQDALDASVNTLKIAITSTLIATVIGTMAALALQRHNFKLKLFSETSLYIPIVIPEIVMGISLLLFFNQALFPLLEALTGYRASTGLHTITLAHIAFDIPFVYVIVRARLADFNRTLEEAAQDLGADEWQTFQRVTLPLLMPGIIGGALMAFTLSLDDYLITVFTKGVREQTMPLYIYSLVRRGVTPEINALSTALLAGSMGLVGLSLTAQSGGPLLTRGMGIGGALGLITYGLAGLSRQWTGEAINVVGVVAHLAPLLTLVWLRRSAPEWLQEAREANLSGRLLAAFALLAAAAAAFISLALLLA